MLFNTITSRRKAKRILVIILSVFVLCYILAPIYWVIVSGFQKEVALEHRPPYLVPPSEILTLNHYKYLFTGKIAKDSTVMLQTMYTMSGTLVYPSIINSLIVALFVTLINFMLGFPAGHVFSRYRFWGDKQLFILLLATRLLPSISIVIPVYILLSKVGLLDTKVALVGIHTAITLPFTIWILQSYFKNIPVEYEEAARMDGCGYFQMLRKVVFPLAKPGIIASLIFAFMASYGEFVFATIITQTVRAKTQTAILAALSQGLSVSRGMIAAAATLSFLPPLLLAIIFRKQVLDGLTARMNL